MGKSNYETQMELGKLPKVMWMIGGIRLVLKEVSIVRQRDVWTGLPSKVESGCLDNPGTEATNGSCTRKKEA